MAFSRTGKAMKKKKDPTISLCMLMCDEAEVLKRCLDAARGLWDELIIVDTGSRDRSIEVAESFGAKIIKVPWMDDFAWARNKGIEKAKCDWIFILDPDEILSPRDIPRVKEYTRKEEVKVYQLATRNYTNNPYILSYTSNKQDYEEGIGYRGYAESNKIRLFKNHIGLRFEGIIHEMIDYQALRRKIEGRKIEVPIHHYQDDAGKRTGRTKAYFMIRICEKKVEESPYDSKAWWELGISQTLLGFNARAVKSMRRSLELASPMPERLITLGLVIQRLKGGKEGERYIEKAICMIHPELTHVKTEYRKALD